MTFNWKSILFKRISIKSRNISTPGRSGAQNRYLFKGCQEEIVTFSLLAARRSKSKLFQRILIKIHQYFTPGHPGEEEEQQNDDDGDDESLMVMMMMNHC